LPISCFAKFLFCPFPVTPIPVSPKSIANTPDGRKRTFPLLESQDLFSEMNLCVLVCVFAWSCFNF
jgi:hypothetical protein